MKPQDTLEGPAAHDSGIFGLNTEPDEAALVLLPIPIDATTSSRRGTAAGPEAIKRASHQMDLFHPALGRPYEAGIVMLKDSQELLDLNKKTRAAVDKARRSGAPAPEGVTAIINGLCQRIDRAVYERATLWLGRNRVVGAVGGDHASVLGNMLAHLNRYPAMAVLQIDAHADLRKAYEGFIWSHASVIYNLHETSNISKIAQVGVRDLCESEYEMLRKSDRITTLLDHDMQRSRMRGESFDSIIKDTIKSLPGEVYITLDIDGLSPEHCPNTGTPVPGGMSYAEVVYLLDAVVESGRRVVGFDINEVSPGDAKKTEDSIDANVAARLLYQLCGLALLDHGEDQTD